MEKFNYQKYFIHPVFFGAAILVLTVFSCKKLVTVPAPTNTLATNSVFTSDENLIAAQLGVYATLFGDPYEFTLQTGLSSDELTNFVTSKVIQNDLYLNNLNAQADARGFYWAPLYNLIYAENAIIQNTPIASGISATVKQYTLGEAYFTRAYCYFQLVNFFGDVPLVTVTDPSVNSTLARASAGAVYQQMISDLKTAQGLLSSSYLDASDNPVSTDHVRPTTWAADALLARVYLYYGNLTSDASQYQNATIQANLVIQNGPYSLPSSLNDVFKMNSLEAIWQLMPPTGVNVTEEGGNFILHQPPSGSPVGVALSPQLLNAFEIGDARRTNWVGMYSSNGQTWYYPFKYQADNTATTVTEYEMVLRLAEVYLVRAEAEANSGQSGLAVTDLNTIRHRANLPDYVFTTTADLLAKIQHERQVELFTEGHRWFDLKRTKTVDAVMSIVTPQKGGVWKSYQQLYPLNPTDLQYDPNLIQNPGY